jgi:hypothetical protein
MPSTYEPISTSTLGSSASVITFSSIPSTYTDLRIVLVCTTSSDSDAAIQFNGDSGTNYSQTNLFGNGSAMNAGGSNSSTRIYANGGGNTSSSTPHLYIIDILSYRSSTHKPVLATGIQDRNGSGIINACIGVWRNTSAITSVSLVTNGSDTFSTNTTATLYGILKA